MFILAIILFLVAAVGILWAIFGEYKGVPALVAIVAAIAGGFFLFQAATFQLDAGEAGLKKTWTGQLTGIQQGEGLHQRAPWEDVAIFDIRNQRIVFTGGDSQGDNSGGQADGPQITVQDADGVTSNIDIAVRYSIDGASIEDIYRDFTNQENLKTKLITNDIRSVVRKAPSQYSTLELLTKRGELETEIFEALTKEWAAEGIIVEDVALQEIRVPDSVKESFAQAQQAQIDVEKARAELEKVEVSAQAQIVEAQAEAQANAIREASLTDRILEARKIEALKVAAEKGQLIIDGSGAGILLNK